MSCCLPPLDRKQLPCCRNDMASGSCDYKTWDRCFYVNFIHLGSLLVGLLLYAFQNSAMYESGHNVVGGLESCFGQHVPVLGCTVGPTFGKSE